MEDRSAYSLLFGKRLHTQQGPLELFVGEAGESRALELASLRGSSWALGHADKLSCQGEDYSASLLRAAVIIEGRPDFPILTPTAQMILYKICADNDINQVRVTSDKLLHPQSAAETLSYLFPSMPGDKTPANFLRLIDNPQPSLLSLVADLIEEGYDQEKINEEMVRRRSVRAFRRRHDDLELIKKWMTERPVDLDPPYFWETIEREAHLVLNSSRTSRALLSDPQIAKALANELGGEDIGLSNMLARAIVVGRH